MSSQPSVHRDFKGIWIPREIWLKPNISLLAKFLWAEIDSLYNREKGGCFASNEYLADFLGVKERRLQELLAELKKDGSLTYVSFDGRERVMKAISPQTEESEPEKEKERPQDRGAEKCTPRAHFSAPTPRYRDKSSPPLPERGARDAEEKPTEEEEEEIFRRLRDRPKGSKPIKSMKLWRKVVLEEIRAGSHEEQQSKSIVDRHKKIALAYDGLTVEGFFICAAKEWVEFSKGSASVQVRYDVSEKEWKSRTSRHFKGE